MAVRTNCEAAMKRRYFLASDMAHAELRLARAYWYAYRAGSGFNANPTLLGLYRAWMREHALAAVRYAKPLKVA